MDKRSSPSLVYILLREFPITASFGMYPILKVMRMAFPCLKFRMNRTVTIEHFDGPGYSYTGKIRMICMDTTYSHPNALPVKVVGYDDDRVVLQTNTSTKLIDLMSIIYPLPLPTFIRIKALFHPGDHIHNHNYFAAQSSRDEAITEFVTDDGITHGVHHLWCDNGKLLFETKCGHHLEIDRKIKRERELKLKLDRDMVESRLCSANTKVKTKTKTISRRSNSKIKQPARKGRC